MPMFRTLRYVTVFTTNFLQESVDKSFLHRRSPAEYLRDTRQMLCRDLRMRHQEQQQRRHDKQHRGLVLDQARDVILRCELGHGDSVGADKSRVVEDRIEAVDVEERQDGKDRLLIVVRGCDRVDNLRVH